MKSRSARALQAVWKLIKHLFGMSVVFLVLAVSWTAARFLTNAVYRYTGRPPWNYVAGLIDVIVGVTIFSLVFMVLSLLFRRKEMAMWNAMIQALRRISKGDFSVHLDEQGINKEFREFTRSINEMASELGRMETMRQDFISNVSHELQSPLTSIQGFAQALRNPAITQDQRAHYLDIIERESRRLSQISDNLLKLSALDMDRLDFETGRFHLDRQLRAIVLSCEPQWSAKDLQIDLDLQEAEIEAAEDLLSQVWINLLHNSIKFTPAGGTVILKLVPKGNHVFVTVSDSGIGIHETDLPRLFERFYKADRSRNRNEGGSGLGLSIVKKIVDIHRGDISVRSTPGEGTEFVIRLPVRWESE